MTQQQLAERSGVALQTVGRHMRGDTPMTVRQLMRYAQAMGCDPASLLPRLDSNQQPFDLPIGAQTAPESSLAGVA